MSLLSPEEQSFITQIRQRYAAKEPVSLEEMKRTILILRQRRTAALTASEASGKTRAKKPAPTAAAVASALDDLDSL